MSPKKRPMYGEKVFTIKNCKIGIEACSGPDNFLYTTAMGVDVHIIYCTSAIPFLDDRGKLLFIDVKDDILTVEGCLGCKNYLRRR